MTIVERDTINTNNSETHDLIKCDCLFSWVDTATYIKCHRVGLVLWAQISPLIEMMTYLTYFTLFHGGHRATTVSFHLVLSWTFFFASPHVVFMACSSEIKPLCHEFFGLPLFLFPWGFHSKAPFVMLLFAFLSVCPIHFHRLDLIVEIIEMMRQRKVLSTGESSANANI